MIVSLSYGGTDSRQKSGSTICPPVKSLNLNTIDSDERTEVERARARGRERETSTGRVRTVQQRVERPLSGARTLASKRALISKDLGRAKFGSSA